MKIIYRQPNEGSVTDKLNISECCLKYIDLQRDMKNTSGKVHHHTETEIHIMISGKQKYEFSDGVREITPGMFLIIPPFASHRAAEYEQGSIKYSVTFKSDDTLPLTVDRLRDSSIMDKIKEYGEDARELSAVLLENKIFELLLTVFRTAGYKEKTVKLPVKTESRIELAKKYISDNIGRRITVSEVASHIYICPKQLNRLFKEYENTTPVQYIEKEKCVLAMKLLKEDGIKIAKAGEMLGFSEQYFNSFFKRNCGMTPGEYKRMNKGEN